MMVLIRLTLLVTAAYSYLAAVVLHYATTQRDAVAGLLGLCLGVLAADTALTWRRP